MRFKINVDSNKRLPRKYLVLSYFVMSLKCINTPAINKYQCRKKVFLVRFICFLITCHIFFFMTNLNMYKKYSAASVIKKVGPVFISRWLLMTKQTIHVSFIYVTSCFSTVLVPILLSKKLHYQKENIYSWNYFAWLRKRIIRNT